MHRAAAALIAFSANVLADPGHGALEGHFHGWGLEHVLLFAMVFAVLALALRKK